jgi:hypothetical protein
VDQLLGIDASRSFAFHVSDSTRTVTISVASVNGTLHSLDTYAPKASWVVDSNLTLPLPSGNGHLRFTAESITGGIVTVAREMIEYRVNLDNGTVRLTLDEAQNIRYAQAASCLIVGIDKKSSDLVEIRLQDVFGQ